MNQTTHTCTRKPIWLKRNLPTGPTYEKIRTLLHKSNLNTVCQEAKCPNLWECFSKKTATFLIMGARCTRNCRFCNIDQGPMEALDPDEPQRVAMAVKEMGLRYAVITSVTRDDLADGGAGHFAAVIKALREQVPHALIEVLIPDFQGDADALLTVLDAGPDVLNHNIETVPRLYPIARPQAIYRRSLELIGRAAAYNPSIPGKSGLMVGLGETVDEIQTTMQDLLTANCKILTIGQYLQPSKAHLPVKRFVPPEEFEALGKTALEMGFAEVASGPFVRSSYQAKDLYEAVKNCAL